MWFWFAITASVLSAITLVLNKKSLGKTSPALVVWSLVTLNTPLIAFMAFKAGSTQINKWFFIGAIGSAIIFSLAKTLSLSSIQKTSLSKIAPLSAFNSVFAYVLALVFLGEMLEIKAIFGLGLITLGAYILNSKKVQKRWLQPFKTLLTDKVALIFLLAIFLTSATAIFDKLSIVNTFPSNPALTILVENIVLSVLLWIYLDKKEPGWKKEFKNNYKELTIMSLIYGVHNILVFSGFAVGSIALVIGVRQLQLLLVLLFGYVMLKDKPSKQSVWASVIMVLGAILIKLS